jgi:hypothetical protein
MQIIGEWFLATPQRQQGMPLPALRAGGKRAISASNHPVLISDPVVCTAASRGADCGSH